MAAAPTVTDTAGNALVGPFPAGEVYTIDKTAPPAPSITAITDDTGTPGDRITSDPTLVLSGTAEAGATVTISRAGTGVIGSATADGSGTWSFDYTGTSLPDGTHTFTATATDTAGNISPISADFIVTVDTSAPPAPSISSPAPGTVTNAQNLALSGSAEPSSLVRIYDGAALLGSISADASGSWNFTTPSLAEGTHSFSATAADLSGNESPPSPSVTVTIDRTAPTVTAVSSPTPNGTYGIGQTVLVTVTFSEPVTLAAGTPQLTLETGDSDAVALYIGGSGTATLTFSYTVAPGHQTPDLDYLSTAALAGATLRDAAGNDADLALPAPAAPGSLSANKDIAIADSNPPAAPAALAQYRIDAVTAIPVGGTTNQTGAVFAATLEDSEGDALRLQIEIQPIGTPFAGAPSATSDPVPSTGRASVSLGRLPDLQGYHWQARTLDSSGRPSPWISFGANPETEPDFRVDRASPGVLPGGGGPGASPIDDKKAGYCSASTAAPTSMPSAALLLALVLGCIPLLRRR
jgi:hypothetical protein